MEADFSAKLPEMSDEVCVGGAEPAPYGNTGGLSLEQGWEGQGERQGGGLMSFNKRKLPDT